MCFNISSFSSSSCPVFVNYIQSHKHHIICRYQKLAFGH